MQKTSHFGICLFCPTVNPPNLSSFTMAYRRAANLLPRLKECVSSPWTPSFQKLPNAISRTVRFPEHVRYECGKTSRTLHTGTPLMVAKLLSVNELFEKKSLQEYLKKIEAEYSDCLKMVNNSVPEEQCSGDELRAKRTKVSQLGPLIQSIRELDAKQKEFAETEMLLKGEPVLPDKTRNSLNLGIWWNIYNYKATIPFILLEQRVFVNQPG